VACPRAFAWACSAAWLQHAQQTAAEHATLKTPKTERLLFRHLLP
jgi:hypothetical protein